MAEKSGCENCENRPNWVCLTCDTKICNTCFPAHLDVPADHETYNVDEENQKMSKIILCGENSQDMLEKPTPSEFLEVPTSPLRPTVSDSDLKQKQTPSLASQNGESSSLQELRDVQIEIEPAKKSPPPIPPRIFPPAEVKSLISANSGVFGSDTPKKIAVDLENCIFVCFEEENRGIKKFGPDGGFIMRFANVAFVRDMSLDSKHRKLYLISAAKNSEFVGKDEFTLQLFCSDTGKFLKVLKNFGTDPFTHIAVNRANTDELFLIDQSISKIKVFNVPNQCFIKQTSLKNVSPKIANCMHGRSVTAISSHINGALYLLMQRLGEKNGALVVFKPDHAPLKDLSVLPTMPGALQEPADLCLNKKDQIFVADPESRRIGIFFKSGVEADIKKSAFLTKPYTYGWKPKSVCFGADGRLYILDGASRNVVRDHSCIT